MTKLSGQSLRRLEDARFLTGQGRFTDDINQPGQFFAHAVRSPHAHAMIAGIDRAAALASPGVIGVYTAADLAGLGPIPCAAKVPTVGPMLIPPRFALASDRVRHVGEPVAFVVAETRAAGLDAAERLQVAYNPLPCVTALQAALAEGAPQLWDNIPNNLSYRFEKGDRAATQSALATAAHVVELELVNNRLIIAPIEHRAAIGEYDSAIETFHLLLSGQGVHSLRAQLADSIFRVAREKIQVCCPDVGGGFGVKNALYPELIFVLWAARHLGRPVKWVSGHAEDFVSTAHGRDNFSRARLALDDTGKFLALDVFTLANLGAAMSTGGPGSSTNAPGNAMGGGYDIQAVFMDVRGIFTNTVPTDAYRGAGKPEANYLIERLIEAAAPVVGIDATELRRRNLVRHFPHRTAIGTTIDGGAFAANIPLAQARANHAHFPARRTATEASGRLRGIGITCFLETARGALDEGAEVKFLPDGKIVLALGTQSNGQGHETSFLQIAADHLGQPIESFVLQQADTVLVKDGNGHGGARSLHQGGSALVKAMDAAIEKGRAIAARLLQAPFASVTFANGAFHAEDRSISLPDAARAAAPDETVDSYVWNKLDLITFPNGCHIAEVEIDPETGALTLDRYTAVDDFGTVINPMLTIGQVQGGVAQGIGQAMQEHTVHDPETGQLLSGSFMDYCIPRAADLPALNIHLNGVPTTANPLGVKGAGQAGAIAAPPAIIAAILNALAPIGVHHIDMPATPERIWRAIQGGKAG
ncbi:MAG: xanthine dehydrogenase family protein molybdopterin-binding subunit [Acetobacteraceae bacterium]|nr:xanthine dehydrogenase family protein molybdopterin-binding subunit [Acetobacteraceae bacterium]